jgi:hypothetical protein
MSILACSDFISVCEYSQFSIRSRSASRDTGFVERNQWIRHWNCMILGASQGGLHPLWSQMLLVWRSGRVWLLDFTLVAMNWLRRCEFRHALRNVLQNVLQKLCSKTAELVFLTN